MIWPVIMYKNIQRGQGDAQIVFGGGGDNLIKTGKGARPGASKLKFAVGSDPGLMEFKNGSVVFLEVKDDRKIKSSKTPA